MDTPNGWSIIENPLQIEKQLDVGYPHIPADKNPNVSFVSEAPALRVLQVAQGLPRACEASDLAALVRLSKRIHTLKPPESVFFASIPGWWLLFYPSEKYEIPVG